jgi:hypothetical protein
MVVSSDLVDVVLSCRPPPVPRCSAGLSGKKKIPEPYSGPALGPWAGDTWRGPVPDVCVSGDWW